MRGSHHNLSLTTTEGLLELLQELVSARGPCGQEDEMRARCDRLLTHGRELGLEPQCAVWSNYGSDASIAKAHGHSAVAGLLCVATANTHGFEIIHRESLSNCARLLAAYLEAPVAPQ